MRGDPLKRLAFAAGLEDQRKGELFEITHPAVNELGRGTRRSGGDIPLLHQGHPQSAQGQIARHAAAVYTAADDEHIEALARQPVRVAGDGRGQVGRCRRLIHG